MAKLSYQTPRGTKDILPIEQPYWQTVFNVTCKTLEGSGFDKIETPHFENIEIYTRGIGEATDIVQKEMFTLAGNDDSAIFALRPEGTAGMVRSYIQNGMSSWSQPVRLYYFGAMFRRERPQKGRYREFYQIGTEIFGDASAKSDYLVIMSAWEILRKLGLKNLIIYTNSIGCPECRPKYIAKLKKYYKDFLKETCEECQARYEKNPLRLLDCKNEKCQAIAEKAPVILDNLCAACRTHFQDTLEYLDYFNIRYDLDSHLVRGLDYYSNTVFEIAEEGDKGRQSSIGGGGRYNGLVETLGGPATPGVGYSLGVERIINLMKSQKVKLPVKRGVEVSILQLGEKAKSTAKEFHDQLVKNDINVYFVPSNDGLRQQIQAAAKLNARYAVIIGQREAIKGEAILRDLSAGTQEVLPANCLVEEIQKRLG